MCRATHTEVVIPNINETDEVVEIKQLYHDTEKQGVLLAVLMRTQPSITFVYVDYKDA